MDSEKPIRFIKLTVVCGKVGFSQSAVLDMIAKGIFPAPVRIGGRSVRWSENEVDAWIEARIAERDAAAASPVPAPGSDRKPPSRHVRTGRHVAKSASAQTKVPGAARERQPRPDPA